MRDESTVATAAPLYLLPGPTKGQMRPGNAARFRARSHRSRTLAFGPALWEK